MPATTIHPHDCPGCPFGETRRGMIHCRRYNMSCMIDYDKKPEYCRIINIRIEEDAEADS